jgi:hypothetical protein
MIALEHPIKINKTATAMITGVLCWTIVALASPEPDLSESQHYTSFAKNLKNAAQLSPSEIAAMPHGENVEQKFQLITVVNEDPLAAAQAFIVKMSDASVDSPDNLTAAPGPPANRIDEAARLCFKKHLRLRKIKYSAYL